MNGQAAVPHRPATAEDRLVAATEALRSGAHALHWQAFRDAMEGMERKLSEEMMAAEPAAVHAAQGGMRALHRINKSIFHASEAAIQGAVERSRSA